MTVSDVRIWKIQIWKKSHSMSLIDLENVLDDRTKQKKKRSLEKKTKNY